VPPNDGTGDPGRVTNLVITGAPEDPPSDPRADSGHDGARGMVERGVHHFGVSDREHLEGIVPPGLGRADRGDGLMHAPRTEAGGAL